MPESEQQKERRELSELQGKNISYYQVMLSAWIQTKMEHDKTIITISSAGIGLLITIGVIAGVRTTFDITLFVMGLIAFVACIVTAVRVYQLNSQLIESAIRGDGRNTQSLKRYDKFILASFLLGVLCLCVIGIQSAFYRYIDHKELKMSENKSTNVTSVGAMKKSLDGIQLLKPSQPIVTQVKPPVAQQPQSASVQSSPSGQGNENSK